MSIITLRPSSDYVPDGGSFLSPKYSTYAQVDDSSDADYASTGYPTETWPGTFTAGGYARWYLQDSAISGHVISSVTLKVRVKASTNPNWSGHCSFVHSDDWTYDEAGGVDFYGITGSYQWFEAVFALNPKTGSAWTWAEINNLRLELALSYMGSTGDGFVQGMVSQVAVEVDYVGAYSLPLGSGSFSLTGSNLNLMASGRIILESGVLTLAGSDMAMFKDLCPSQYQPKLSFRGALGL